MRVVLAVTFASMVLSATPAFAATAGPAISATGASVTGIGTVAWTNPGRITADDTLYATAALTNATSNYLQGSNFGLNVPAGATVTGIQVEIMRQSNNAASPFIRDSVVRLSKGGTITGDNKAALATNWPNAMTATTYGGVADLWGTTWTPADINNANFAVVLAATTSVSGAARTASVDFIRVTVTYTPAPGGPAQAGTGANVAGVGTAAWTNPTRITNDDTLYATAALSNATPISNYLQGSNYGLSVPTGATITGIQVEIMRQSNNAASPFIRDSVVRLSKGGTITGDNKAALATNWPNAMTATTYGGVGDLWGTTWTPADVNNANFGVALSATRSTTGTARTASVDYMRITVYYSLTLTYSAGANGSIAGVSPQTVPSGSSGTSVTAVPNVGYHFTSWSDGVLTAERRETNVAANVSVTANFAINTYTLKYAGGANGTLSGVTSQTVNYDGSGTAVTALADPGYHFVGWSDFVLANPRTDANVMADVDVYAIFAPDTYTLTYTAGANGSITGTSPQTVNSGSDGTPVSAVADAGYHFVKWSDDVTANPRTDTGVTADVSVSAIFAPDTYTLTYTAGANGSITGASPQTVNSGSDGTPVSAVADAGYHFVKWSDDVTANPRTDTGVTADVSVSAIFAPRHLHPDLHRRGQRLDHRRKPPDGQLRLRRHARERRGRRRLPLREVVRRRHRQPAHRHGRHRRRVGERHLRASTPTP